MDSAQQLLIKMSLLGGAATRAELGATSVSMKEFGDVAATTGDKTAFASEKTFALGEAMYSIRRYAFYALTAIGVTGAGILKMGYDFDEAKAKSTGALTALVGGAGKAQIEVSKLIALTHTSGLGLSTLTTATQDMLNFGFSVRDTNAYLGAFADFSGKMGLGSAGVTGLASLFNTVQNQGFLTEKTLRSFASLTNLPANKIVSQALHLSPAYQYELEHGKIQISASGALPELASYLAAYAKKQPTNLSQQWGIAHSYLSQITGAVGQPVFDWLDKLAPSINSLLSRASKAGGGVSGMLAAIDPSNTLLHGWQVLTDLIRVFTGSLKDAWTVLKPVAGFLLLVSSAALTLASYLGGISFVLKPFIALFVIARTAMYGWAAATYIGTVAMATFRFGVVLLRAAWMLLDAAMIDNPIGLIVIGITALAIGFYELYEHCTWFRNAANTLWHDLIYYSPFVATALGVAFGPIGVAAFGLLEIIRYWKEIKGFLGVPLLGSTISAGVLKDQKHLVATQGIAATAAIDAKDKITVTQLRKADPHASSALVSALEQAIIRANKQSPPITGDVHMDTKKVGDVVFRAKEKVQAHK